MIAKDIIQKLGLTPHPKEGGFFREVYRSAEVISTEALNPKYGAQRSVSTAIYYFLTPETCSQLHRLKSDEIFHFYLGDPVTILMLHPGGRTETITLGGDILNGHCVQHLVPAGVWQGACLNEGGRYALLGCTVAPGFDYSDYEHGQRQELADKYPDHAGLIKCLTPER